MKKRYYVLLLLTTFVLCLSGCGKSARQQASENLQNELSLSEEEANELADAFMDVDTSAENDTSNSETVTNECEHFDAVQEWQNLTANDYAIQIDDVLYILGGSADEFISSVESSSVEYAYEYNKDKILSYNDEEQIVFSRDGVEWFTAIAKNFNEETTKLSNLPIVRIKVKEDAQDYCYYLGGKSYADFLSMSYDEVKSYAEEYLPDYSFEEEPTSDKDVIAMIYKNENGILEKAKWTGYGIVVSDNWYFHVDENSSKVTRSSIYTRADIQWCDYPQQPITLFSELSTEENAALVSSAQDAIAKEHDFSEINVVGSCFQKGNIQTYMYFESVQFYNMCTVFELIKSDGSKSYIDCELLSVARDVNDQVVFESNYVGEEQKSVEDVIRVHTLTNDITDTTLEE